MALRLDSRGSVKVGILSPTRVILIKKIHYDDPLWALPGGGIDDDDTDIIGAIIRETAEETGIELLRSEIEHILEETLGERYAPHLCIARISEEKLDTRKPFGDENGRRLQVAAFDRSEVPTMPDLLERHRPFVHELEQRYA